MPQDNSERPSTPSAIAVGQLVYTSFEKFGFRMLKSPDTPPFIQKSFVDKIVNARWDPHSPSSSDFRATYIYQGLGEESYTVFGWLYYDGHDDFGRAGVPYFLSYYHLGRITAAQLQIFVYYLEKGPIIAISRQLQEQYDLESITLDATVDYRPARLGVNIPANIYQKSQKSLELGRPIDWFITRTASAQSSEPEIQVYETPVPEIILTETSDDSPGHAIQLAETALIAPVETRIQSQAIDDPMSLVAQQVSVKTQKVETILLDFVNKTMGIQGVALISDEGQPIVSAMGLEENSIEVLAGTMLYMTQITHQELNWSQCDWVTLRGPETYLMLRSFGPGVYLLIKSAKVPMGLLEGVVKRMTTKLKDELEEYSIDFMALNDDNLNPRESSQQANPQTTLQMTQSVQPPLTPSNEEVPELLKAVLNQENSATIANDEMDIVFEDDITYRGRPTSS